LSDAADAHVYALWKDKVFYSGRIRSVTSDRHALVVFDDGNELHVQLNRIIVCDLLPVGATVLAPRSEEHEWSELSEVVGHYQSAGDSDKAHDVEFIADRYQCRSVLVQMMLLISLFNSCYGFNIFPVFINFNFFLLIYIVFTLLIPSIIASHEA